MGLIRPALLHKVSVIEETNCKKTNRSKRTPLFCYFGLIVLNSAATKWQALFFLHFPSVSLFAFPPFLKTKKKNPNNLLLQQNKRKASHGFLSVGLIINKAEESA